MSIQRLATATPPEVRPTPAEVRPTPAAVQPTPPAVQPTPAEVPSTPEVPAPEPRYRDALLRSQDEEEIIIVPRPKEVKALEPRYRDALLKETPPEDTPAPWKVAVRSGKLSTRFRKRRQVPSPDTVDFPSLQQSCKARRQTQRRPGIARQRGKGTEDHRQRTYGREERDAVEPVPPKERKGIVRLTVITDTHRKISRDNGPNTDGREEKDDVELLPAGEVRQERTGDIVIVSDERPGTCDVGIQVGEGAVHVESPFTTTDDLIEGPVTLTKEDDQQQAQEKPDTGEIRSARVYNYFVNIFGVDMFVYRSSNPHLSISHLKRQIYHSYGIDLGHQVIQSTKGIILHDNQSGA